MKRWIIKILKLSTYRKYKKEFGKKIAHKYYKYSLLYLLTNKQKYQDLKWILSKEYIKTNYKNYLIVEKETAPLIDANFKTFFFWYQGINNNTPKPILLCLESIKKYAQNVVIIDKNNYKQYADLPNIIIEKFEKGIIDITHFSDILRTYLLAKHGGLWLDSTIFLTKPIDHLIGYPYWTIRYPGWPNSIFAMAVGKNNPLFTGLSRFYEKYYSDHNLTIDYFLLDQLISLYSESNRIVNNIIVSVPYNNDMVLKIFKKFFYKKYNAYEYDKALINTHIYKITYKRSKLFRSKPNTLYKFLLKEYNLK
ncbi:MAG: capsular polysaccharide synthesis protein [Bacilli bacterium]|nr:capsular polysaccharide synthesis protein [Bacilli bacterium]